MASGANRYDTPETRVGILRDIVDNCQATKMLVRVGDKRRVVLVDMTTANLYLQVHDHVDKTNQDKLNSLPFTQAVALCNKLVGKTKS